MNSEKSGERHSSEESFRRNRAGLINDLLARACADADAWQELLELYRPYLKMLAGRLLDRRIRARIDVDDVMQETMADATRRSPTFQGSTEAAFTSWIMTILRRQVSNAHRKHIVAEKRSVLSEVQHAETEESASFSWHTFATDDSAPVKRVITGERQSLVARLFENLPEDQATVLQLRHVEGVSFASIAGEMKITEKVAAKLLRKAVVTVAREIEDNSDFSSWLQEAARTLLAKGA